MRKYVVLRRYALQHGAQLRRQPEAHLGCMQPVALKLSRPKLHDLRDRQSRMVRHSQNGPILRPHGYQNTRKLVLFRIKIIFSYTITPYSTIITYFFVHLFDFCYFFCKKGASSQVRQFLTFECLIIGILGHSNPVFVHFHIDTFVLQSRAARRTSHA